MRLMQRIRTRFRVFFLTFAIIFVVSVFAGLGIGSLGNSPMGAGAQAPTSKIRTLVPGESSVAMIEGRNIGYDRLYERIQLQRNNRRGQVQEQPNDPFAQWKEMSDVLDVLLTQEILLKYAQEQNLSVSDIEALSEIDKQVDMMFPPEEDKVPSKTVVGAAGKWLRTATEREKYRRQFLETTGTTLSALKQDMRLELLVKKAYDSIEKVEAGKAETKAQEKLKKIQAALKGGEDFSAVAKEYSEDTGTRETGGVVDQFISRGFFDAAFDGVVFKMKKGEVSEPIKVEFGYQIVKLLDRKTAEGPEFESAKPRLTSAIKQRQGEDYEVTEEDLKNEFEQVKIQHITIRTLVERETYGRIYWMTFAAKKEIYDPMILAWRAANGEPLFFPDITKTTPEQLAQDSLLTQGADLSKLPEVMKELLRVKMMRFQYTYGDPPEDLRQAFADYKLEYGKPRDDQRAPEYPELTKPYPLAEGLARHAIKLNEGLAIYHYSIARIIDEWANDPLARQAFPMDLDAGRAAIEEHLNEAVKLYEHNGYFFALAGKNYAAWVKPEQAREMLIKAEKFAPGDIDLIQILISAYRINGDKEKGDYYQDLLLKEQQKRWQQQGNFMRIE